MKKAELEMRLQYDHSSLQVNSKISREKRLQINAFACYQWLLLGDGRISIWSSPCHYKRVMDDLVGNVGATVLS